MKYIELLYYKYYWFQVKVGNADVASFTSLLIIVFITNIYIVDLIMLFIFIFPSYRINLSLKAISIISVLALCTIFYFLLIYNGKYKQIINNKDFRKSKRGNIFAILFPASAILLFILSTGLKCLQNNGII